SAACSESRFARTCATRGRRRRVTGGLPARCLEPVAALERECGCCGAGGVQAREERSMPDILITDVKTRIFRKEGDTVILDVGVWPQCGLELPASGTGDANQRVPSDVEGQTVTAVNLVIDEPNGRAWIDVHV